jgi:hypothetical protein
MDKGLRQVVSYVDLEASCRLDVDECSRLLLEVQRQLLNVILLSGVFVNDGGLIFGVYVREDNSLRARIKQLENVAAKGKKSHEDTVTREGTSKKEVEAVVGLERNWQLLKRAVSMLTKHISCHEFFFKNQILCLKSIKTIK